MRLIDPPPGTVGVPAGPLGLIPAGQTANTKAATALITWYAALGNRFYSPANFAIIGDSITSGGQASQWNRGFPTMTAAALRARLGMAVGGRGFIPAINTPGGYTYSDFPAVSAGGVGHESRLGPNRYMGLLQGAGQTFTFTLVGTSVDIMWYQFGGGGSFSWAVDGGAATNVSTNNSPSGDGHKTRVALGAAGAHTLVVSWVSGGAYVSGVIEYNGDETAGILVHGCGQTGWSTANWATTTSPFGSLATNWPAAIAGLSPAAVGIMLGTNDVNTGVTVAQYQANLATIIAAVRSAAGITTVPVVLIEPFARTGHTADWPGYLAAAYAVAAADPLTVVCDLTTRLPAGDAATTYGLYNGDLIHPNDKGMAYIADLLAAFLVPA